MLFTHLAPALDNCDFCVLSCHAGAHFFSLLPKPQLIEQQVEGYITMATSFYEKPVMETSLTNHIHWKFVLREENSRLLCHRYKLATRYL